LIDRGINADQTHIYFLTDGSLDFNQTQDITALGRLDYSRTTFNRQTGRLLADVRLTNFDADPLAAPVLAIVSQITPPSVELATADGIDPTGRAYVNFDMELGPSGLARERTFLNVAHSVLRNDRRTGDCRDHGHTRSKAS
jgi:hypothetical protein